MCVTLELIGKKKKKKRERDLASIHAQLIQELIEFFLTRRKQMEASL